MSIEPPFDSPPSRRLFERIAELAPNLLYLFDLREQKNVFCNRAVSKAFDLPAEQFRYASTGDWLASVHPDDASRLKADFEQLARETSDRVYECEFRLKMLGQGYRWIRHRGTVFQRDEQGSPTQILGVGQDVTDAKVAAEEVRASEERYRAFISQSSEAIWRFELEQPVATTLPLGEQIDRMYEHAYLAECNDAMARMYGFEKKEEILGARLGGMLVRTDPQNIDFLRAFIISGYRLVDAETAEKHRDGNTKYFLNSLSGIVENGQLVRAWGVQRDMTKLKQVEKKLREHECELSKKVAERTTELEQALQEKARTLSQLHQSRNLEAVGRLAGGIAHDFNNLVTGILGTCYDLSQATDVPPRMQSDLAEIASAAERAGALTKQLLAFGRRQIIAPQVVNLNEILKGLQPLIRRLIGADIDLRFQLHPLLGWVRIDPSQVEQVLINLAMNARDAMPSGGSIRIETCNMERTIDAEQGRLGRPAGPYVMLSVSDTGHGMSMETQAHVFEPFFSTKPKDKGTGLGLATVYGIVKQNGGDIVLQSREGEGTEFRLFFPRVHEVPAPALQALPASGKPVFASGSETILVVEDEALVRRVVSKALVKSGYKVLEAQDGREAINLGATHDGTIDLLLTDIVMPYFDGRQVAEALERSRPGMKVLYMTGYTEDAVVNRGLVHKGISLIQKTFTADSLCARVREVLDQA